VRATDGSGELPVPAYDLFSSSELLGEMAMAKMLAKLSTRRYRAGLEPVGTAVEATAKSTSKSAVSRRFVEATETALAELLAGDLSGLNLVALMVDGVHFADHLLVVALGIGTDGTKHPMAVVEGSTENATLVTDLLVGLRDRGLDVTRPVLVVIDGSKALSAAVRAVFDHPVIARCQLHKIRNVVSKLPEALGSTVAKKMRAAYRMNSALAAQAALESLAETLTVMRLGVAPTLARTLRTTNPVESMIEICRDHSTNVKRWRDGQMALRWCAAGMVEATKQFRKVNGFLHLPLLRKALEAEVANITVTPPDYDQEVA
jgi:transposase-like protein